MSNQPTIETPATVASQNPFDDFIARLSAKDRANAVKRVAAMSEDPARLALWQRMVLHLFALAKHSAKVNNAESVQFYAADGKYRIQLWTLQDSTPGELTIYSRDVLDELLNKKIVRKPTDKPLNRYPINGTDDSLVIEPILAQVAEHPAAYRDLMSWNRKCMRIDLPLNASPALIEAVDRILELSMPAVKA